MAEFLDVADELGPAKIIHVYEPKTQMKGVLVVDNIALGPALGGVRLGADVTPLECFRLARAMTLKNAAAGLAHGGGKIVVSGDPDAPQEIKERLLRALAAALRDIRDYIFAPDMGTDEGCMAWIRDETERVVGLPRELGGIPLDEIGATGWGLRHAAEVAAAHLGVTLDGATVVVQGFGSVGMNAARFLSETGAVIIAAADINGTVYHPSGLNVSDLIDFTADGNSVAGFPGGERRSNESLIDIPCDIWIPAARPDVINRDNVYRLKTRIVVPGANIGVTPEAESILHQRGVLCLPDFIANAGGVICAAMEYRRACESEVFTTIRDKITTNTRTVLELSKQQGILPRKAAETMAVNRVKKAMQSKRWSIY